MGFFAFERYDDGPAGASDRRTRLNQHRSRQALEALGRVAAGAIRIGNAVGAAFTNRLVLESIGSRILVMVGLTLLTLSILFAISPGPLVYPIIVVFAWIAAALPYRGYKLHRRAEKRVGCVRLLDAPLTARWMVRSSKRNAPYITEMQVISEAKKTG